MIAKSTTATSSSSLLFLGNINVNDLFAKLIATGIVQAPVAKEEAQEEQDEVKQKPKKDKTFVHPVNLLKPETLRV